MSDILIKNLQNADLYDHPVANFRVIETHISWVILTGEYAYKIKKPMDFGFLDFSTLEKRRHYCEEELRLNRRLAPEIYLEVIGFSGNEETPHILARGAPDGAFEFAVKMRQFDADKVLTNLNLDEQALAPVLGPLISEIAEFHRTQCAVADGHVDFGNASEVMAPVRQNFEQIGPMLLDEKEQPELQRISAWAEAQYEQYRRLMDERKRDGFTRECHGDLHFGNIALQNNRALLFDCIEFNESFRWIDVLNDLAFLLMDLDDRGMSGLGSVLLNQYLEHTGDYQGASLLPFYKSYRAMVRCKIALFTYNAPGLPEALKQAEVEKYRRYLKLAASYVQPASPRLILTQGLSGSGKTTFSNQLISRMPLIRIRSDVERKRLAGLGALDSSRSGMDTGIYTPELSATTYGRLLEYAKALLASGQSVIADATFLKQSHRQPFMDLAKAEGYPFTIAACEVDQETAKTWLDARQVRGDDAAEADFGVYLKQKEALEDFSESESAAVVRIQMDDENSVRAGLAHIAGTH